MILWPLNRISLLRMDCLLTGDRYLRTVAAALGVRVHGVLWIVDELEAAGACDDAFLIGALDIWKTDRSVFLPDHLNSISGSAVFGSSRPARHFLPDAVELLSSHTWHVASPLTAPVMRRKPRAHLRQSPPKPGGLLDRDALSPREQVPAHLVDSAGPESHRQ